MTQNDRDMIVPLRRYHLDRMAEIEALCFSVPWTRSMLEQELTAPLSRYFVYEREGEVLGYVGTRMILDECHITNVATHPDFQRQGIARALLRELEDYARRERFGMMTLEVRESNTPARAFYEGQGFLIAGRRPGYYDLPTEDALLMTKILIGPEDEPCLFLP